MRRRARVLRSVAARQERKMLAGVTEWLQKSNKMIRDDFTIWVRKAKYPIPADVYGQIEENGRLILKPIILDSINVGTEGARGIVGITGAFDVLNPHSVNAAERMTGALVTDVTKATKDAINEIITNKIKEGQSMGQAARAIKPHIGLTTQGFQRLAKYEQVLIERGYSGSQLQKALTSRSQQLIRERSRIIARTETSRAVSEGNLMAYEDLGAKIVVWNVSPGNVCDECLSHANEEFTVGAAYGLIPAHVSCYCAWLPKDDFKPYT